MSWSTRIRSALAVFDYVFFGMGGSCVSLILLVISPFCRKKKAHIGSRVLQYSWKLMCFVLRITYNLKLTVPQKAQMEQIRRSIIVANHPSLIDVVILTSIIPKCMLIVKPALLRWPFLRPILKHLCIINDGNTPQMLQQAAIAMRKGFNIIIFPEGTRTTPGKKSKLHRGAFHLAIHSHAPLVPIHIDANPPFLTKEYPWWYVGERCPHFTLTLHSPIYAQENPSAHKEAVRLSNTVAALLGLD